MVLLNQLRKQLLLYLKVSGLSLKTLELLFNLKTAEQDLQDAQDNLNAAIRGYGTNSKEAATALRDLNSAQANVSTLQAQVGATTEQNTASMRELCHGSIWGCNGFF